MFPKTLSLQEALALVLERVKPLVQTETLPVFKSLCRVLAHEVVAPQDLPGFDRSGMDGFAVRAADTYGAGEARPVPLKLAGRIEMGQDASKLPALSAGEAVGISTGGMLPPGADAVVILEETELQGERLLVLKPVAPGGSVIRADEDFKRGEVVLRVGHCLRPQDLGALLAVGITEVEAFARLQVGILSTGDELVPADQPVSPGRVRDINSAALAAQVSQLGMQPTAYGIIPDQRQQLAQATSHALAECDAVLISGGSSVGVRDATVQVLEDLGEVLLHGIRIAPGKPTIFALCGDKPVFGLPGNPVSSIVVFEKVVSPALQKRSGRARLGRHHPQVQAVLSKNVPSARGRDDFVRIKLERRDGAVYAEPIYAHSNNISSLSKADGMLAIPAGVEGYAKGEPVTVELW